MQEIQIRLVLIVRRCRLIQVWNEFTPSASAVVIARGRVGERVGILNVEVGFHIVVHSVVLRGETSIDQHVREIFAGSIRSILSSKGGEILEFGVFFEITANANLIAYPNVSDPKAAKG